ncbi:MAG: heavy metal sensor histidine kinase [Gammaproteobacteria bacterium]|nr:heavy metal sensor histidine kinase [Gammaproteobacteria bacterium]
MRRPTSLTLRLTLLFSAVATVVLLAFGWVIERSIEEHFAMQDAKELKVVAQAVERSISILQPDYDLTQIKQRFDDILIGHHHPLLSIRSVSGESLYSSAGADLSRVPLPSPEQLLQVNIAQWNDGNHHYRVLIQQIRAKNNTPYTVIIAVAIDFHRRFLKNFHYTLWLMIVGSIAIMGLMSWIAVRQGHRPLHRIVEQISQTSASALNSRLDPATVPTELTELALSFNDLLQRMEEAFTRLANFSADIAHELRTPVTNLMTQTQVVLSQARSADEYQEILYSNMEEYERMAQMISDMLFLAKADNALEPPSREVIDLRSELRNLFDYYEAWAEESHVSLTLEGDAHVQGDRLMLRRALSNLLSNAVRYTPQGSSVTVNIRHTRSAVVIVVKNLGTPIPAEHLPKIFDRFYRTDPSRQRSGEGAGLGLAIVKSIVEAHGGTIVVSSDETGTAFIISLPDDSRSDLHL